MTSPLHTFPLPPKKGHPRPDRGSHDAHSFSIPTSACRRRLPLPWRAVFHCFAHQNLPPATFDLRSIPAKARIFQRFYIFPQKTKNKIVFILTTHHIGVYTNVVPRNTEEAPWDKKGERNRAKNHLHPVSLALSHKKREP